MKIKPILLRDHSEESEEAEKILNNYSIDFAYLFCSDGRLPSLISSDSAYAFEGVGGIRLFVSNLAK
ncbi:MAG: hypothetical protein UW04_C0004G0014 [Parcubacteria group bacterium GW2011_GWB1_43_8]|nr:MAG: hypothetical protein UW04_C0004G0014 [Parcubacteria group bacterium GW2011_GWB1_43_8]